MAYWSIYAAEICNPWNSCGSRLHCTSDSVQWTVQWTGHLKDKSFVVLVQCSVS